jgi:hypothetical protein
MTNRLHRMTLAQKVPYAYISSLDFEFLDSHDSLPPLGLINDTITTLANITLNLELLPVNLQVRVECTVLRDAGYLKLG